MERLAVIMPVYNEEEAIGKVLDKWVNALDKIGMEYTINPYNDGSKDGSLKVIEAKAEEYPGKVIAHTKPNGGHGPTILQGYREAAEAGYTWVFQIDSDDEMGPEGFAEIWNARENYDFLVGIRDGRKQALPRKIISAVSRMSVRLFYGKSIWDVNTPYRLMRVSAFKEIWERIPRNTFAPNVIISGMAGFKKLRCYETRVPQRDRQTGEVSIKKWKLFKVATRSFWQTIVFSVQNANFFYPMSFLLSTLFFSLMINFTPIAITPFSSTDSEVFFTVGRAIRNGFIPYRDIFDHKGPIIYFINALGDFIGGFRGIGIIEILFWISFLFILAKIRKLFKLDLLIFSIIILLLPTLIAPLLASGNLVEEYALPFIAFGNLYLIKVCENKELQNLDNFLLGIFAAATLCLRPNMIAVFLIDGLALLFVYLIRKRKLLSLIYAIIFGLCGALTVLIPICLYFYFSNALQDMYFCVWKFNLLYSLTETSLNEKIVMMLKRIISNNYIFISCLLSAFLFFVRKREENLTCYIFLLLNLMFSSFTCIFSRSIFEHYFLVLIPIFIILLGKFCSEIKLNIYIQKVPLLFFCLVFLNFIAFSRSLIKHISSIKESFEFKEVAQFFASESSIYRNKTIVLGNKCLLYRKLKLEPNFKYIYQEPIIRFSSDVKKDFLQSIAQQDYEYIIDTVFFEKFKEEKTSDNIVQEINKTINAFYRMIISNNKYVVYKKINIK